MRLAFSSIPASAPAALALPPGKVPVCGQGLVDAAELERDDETAGRAPWSLAWEQGGEQLRGRVQQHLIQSGREFDRVAAALLEGQIEAAATLARHSTDARVYALALKTCAGRTQLPACDLLSAARWAQLEPDNAASWLAVGEAAKLRGDEAAQLDALHRVALAPRMDTGFAELTGHVDATLLALGGSPDDGAAGWLMVHTFGRDMARGLVGFGAMAALCAPPALRDANRRQLCQGVARMLIKQGQTLADISIGLSLAKRVGIPAEEFAAIRAEFDAAQKWQAEELAGAPEQTLSCEAFQRMRMHFREVGTRGEWPAMRARVAAKGASRAAGN